MVVLSPERSRGAKDLSVSYFALTSPQSTLMQKLHATPLKSTLTKTKDLNPSRINTYKKKGLNPQQNQHLKKPRGVGGYYCCVLPKRALLGPMALADMRLLHD